MAVGKEVFGQILADAERRNMTGKLNRRAIAWFRRKVKSTTKKQKVSTRSLMSQKEDLTGRILIGRMYHFMYSAKHAKTLPYWDRFPLVIPIETDSKSFLGLNLHYLPPRLRAKLMDALYRTISDKKLGEKAKLRISYNMLAGASKYKYFEPTVKRYLYSHVKSRFLKIDPQEWAIALFLPSERFVKSTSKSVWSDSKKIIRKR